VPRLFEWMDLFCKFSTDLMVFSGTNIMHVLNIMLVI